VLGAGNDVEEAHEAPPAVRQPSGARQALESVWEFWKCTLGVVYAETPDPALNLLVNGWLEYQALAARYWGRSGYYQSGGAYGFRDQLQDTTALLHAAPWPPASICCGAPAASSSRATCNTGGIRPAAAACARIAPTITSGCPTPTCRYVTMTGDTGVLDERAPYLEGHPVNADEESYYDLPRLSGTSGTLYEHCVRAIEHGLRFGAHGLPLIGSGDWNDGMNLVGAQGKGESVWLAFFLCRVLRRFAELARRRDDTVFADRCDEQAAQLQQNIEAHGWDGEWYRRAYFDDGTPLGSADNEECQIDSIAQSWAVLSGAADPARARQAMDHVYRAWSGATTG
jgi:cyclic beta-1,2-glucan synthetase